MIKKRRNSTKKATKMYVIENEDIVYKQVIDILKMKKYNKSCR